MQSRSCGSSANAPESKAFIRKLFPDPEAPQMNELKLWFSFENKFKFETSLQRDLSGTDEGSDDRE